MLSVAIHKDIAEYQPKVIGKLRMNDARTPGLRQHIQ